MSIVDWFKRLMDAPDVADYAALGFEQIDAVEDVDRVISASKARPVFVYKHSSRCGVSIVAQQRILEYLKGASGDASFYHVDVLTARPLSDAIAQRLGIHHQSPQLILIRDGEVVWDASHGAVNGAGIEAALQQA